MKTRTLSMRESKEILCSLQFFIVVSTVNIAGAINTPITILGIIIMSEETHVAAMIALTLDMYLYPTFC